MEKNKLNEEAQKELDEMEEVLNEMDDAHFNAVVDLVAKGIMKRDLIMKAVHRQAAIDNIPCPCRGCELGI